jgi:Protein of unknown function (DUF1203)
MQTKRPHFRIRGLSPDQFSHLWSQTTERLATSQVHRCIANACPGYPDRIELRDAEPGESLLLLNYVHQPADTPYRAAHAIFVREGARQAYDRVDEVPQMLRERPISLRAFDDKHLMVDADLVDGGQLESLIFRFFDNANVSYLQAHLAQRGCYAARVERVLEISGG